MPAAELLPETPAENSGELFVCKPLLHDGDALKLLMKTLLALRCIKPWRAGQAIQS
jgi:hypothetical protein